MFRCVARAPDGVLRVRMCRNCHRSNCRLEKNFPPIRLEIARRGGVTRLRSAWKFGRRERMSILIIQRLGRREGDLKGGGEKRPVPSLSEGFWILQDQKFWPSRAEDFRILMFMTLFAWLEIVLLPVE